MHNPRCDQNTTQFTELIYNKQLKRLSGTCRYCKQTERKRQRKKGRKITFAAHFEENFSYTFITFIFTVSIFEATLPALLATVGRYLPSSVVTQASMASSVTRLKMSEVEADGAGRQTACRSQRRSCGRPRSSVRMLPRRQGQTVTVTVAVLVRPEAPSRSTTGT